MDGLSFSNPTPTTFTYNLNTNVPWTGTNTLKYSVTAPTGKVLYRHTASLTSSVIPETDGKYTVLGSNGDSATGVMVKNDTVSGSVMYATNLTSESYTATLKDIANGAGVLQVTSTYVVKDAPTSGVPAPLPLLGAGAAFGFSRKLRRRIKQAA